MLILNRISFTSNRHLIELVLLFGTGLIGSELAESLVKRGFVVHKLNFNWCDSKQQDLDIQYMLSSAFAVVKNSQYLIDSSPIYIRLSVAWAAGAAGFAGSQDLLNEELNSYQKVLDITEFLNKKIQPNSASFHLISSAGGLFEGQQNINISTQPNPKRPYGCAKVKQETMLECLPKNINKIVYRPSTVYGVRSNPNRKGLIYNLLTMGISREAINFNGSMDTLRDYVCSNDVADYISRQLVIDQMKDSLYFLVSGRPVSIFHLKKLVERCIGKKVNIIYEHEPNNSADICFKQTCVPADWNGRTVEEGIHQLYCNLKYG